MREYFALVSVARISPNGHRRQFPADPFRAFFNGCSRRLLSKASPSSIEIGSPYGKFGNYKTVNDANPKSGEGGNSGTSNIVYPDYQPWLLGAVLFCFLWFVSFAFGLLEGLPLPAEFLALLGFLTPLVAASAMLHRTDLYRERRGPARFFSLVGVSFAMLIFAGVLASAACLMIFYVTDDHSPG